MIGRLPKPPVGFKYDRCENCLGQRFRTPKCENCKGNGTLPNPKGPTYQKIKCKPCKGVGRIKKPCYRCGGRGKMLIRDRS